MNPQRLFMIRIGTAFTLMVLALLVGCSPISLQNGGRGGPPSGVVEMDQNTDPRFFLRHRRGAVGRLKVAGNEVQLNGRRVVRDVNIQNGAHVSTGKASAAVIDFFPSRAEDCGLEVRDFRHGQIFGLAERCGHLVMTEQGAMETRGWNTTYHVEARGDRETVFTAIEGEASVWRHADPGYIVFVPSYHQVRLSRTRISPPRRVSRGEVASITRWRKNFRQWGEVSLISVPDLRKRQIGEVRRMLDRLGLGLSVKPPNAGSGYRVYRQSPRAGTEVREGTVVRVDVRSDRPTVIIPKVTVPNLRNRSLADARKILERLGLGLRYSPRNAAENYWVSGQGPPAGRKVDRGTTLNLTLQPPIY